MRRKFFILYVFSVFLPVMASAQSLTNRERRHINTQVLALINDYESYSTLYDDDAAYYFERLFRRDGKATLTCDMMGSELYLKQLSVPDYINQFTSYSMTTNILIRDVSKGEMQIDGNKVLIPVTFRKNVSYMDKDGYLFSVSEFYSDDFIVNMTLSYDRKRDLCLIESIDAKLVSDKRFPVGRFLIVNENKTPDKKYMRYFSDLTVGGSNIEFNNKGQALLTSGMAEVEDPDVKVLTDTLTKGFNYDVVSFAFKVKDKRLKFRYGIAPISAYKVNNPYSGVDDYSMAMEFGLDYGITWPVGPMTKMGVFIGAGLSISSLKLTLNDHINYNYFTTAFSDDYKLFKDKTITYDITAASEKIRYCDFMVPLYLSFEHRLSHQVMLSWDLGVKGYVPMGAYACRPYEITASAKMDDQDEVGPIQFIDGYIEPNTYGKDRKFDMSVMADVGVEVSLLENELYGSFHLGYEHGIMSPVYSSGTNEFYSSVDSGTGVFPIVYDIEGSSHIRVHSLISGVSFSRRALWFSAGLKYKF